jgi:hypothetical protein
MGVALRDNGHNKLGMGIFLLLLVEPLGYYFVKPVTLGPPCFF